MTTTPRARLAGGVLDGRYRVDDVIARGGMSVVYRGMDLRLDRPVAVKVLDRALAEDPAFVRRFEREARAAARLAHPGIVAVHDQGRDDDGTVFLVLELVEGGTLRDVLREHRRLRPGAALTVVEQVVVALQVAHDRGFVHRDVKPENVLIAASGAVKVADFGLVGAAWERDDGSDELILGTAAYLSPEQVADGHADARSDLYAAGIVLFELLTGVPPHSGDSASAVTSAHVHADVPPPSRLVAGIPRALDSLVLAMTRRDPDRRPADAAAFLDAARRARASAELAFLPVPPPRPSDDWAGPASADPPPRHGTRLLELDDEDDDLDEGPAPERGEDPAPEWDEDEPPARRARSGPVHDDVDDRIERLARRRARARSRRVLAVWTVGVGAVTVAAWFTGWSVGLP